MCAKTITTQPRRRESSVVFSLDAVLQRHDIYNEMVFTIDLIQEQVFDLKNG